MFHFSRFPLSPLCVQDEAHELHSCGFPHSDIPGSKVACHLPETFRRLPRLSSAPSCQAIHRMPLRASTIQNDKSPCPLNGDSRCTQLLTQYYYYYLRSCLARMTSCQMDDVFDPQRARLVSLWNTSKFHSFIVHVNLSRFSPFGPVQSVRIGRDGH